ncbi:MAG: NADH-quinone oxidoreductase subunit C [Bacillus sp. (in: firmicutes)]
MSDKNTEQEKNSPKTTEAQKEKIAKQVDAKETPKAEMSPEKAKALAAAKAKARAAKAPEETNPLEPSYNQPLLDRYIQIIEEQLGKGHVEDYYINRLSKHVPTLIVKPESYFSVASVLKHHTELQFDYVVELHGTDFADYIELYVYLYALSSKYPVVVKVKLNRERPVIPSLVPLWEGANWPECEAYDLLGIHFENHPELKRILLGEEWIGHPLRKDYEPHDVEV